MDWITALLGGLGSVVGGVIGQQGADAAAKQQADAIKRAIDMQTGNLKTVIGLQKGTTDKIVGNQTNATNRAVDQQNKATERAVLHENRATNASIGDQRTALKTASAGLMPWLSAGKKALTQYQGELGLSKTGANGKPFKSEFRKTPGYQFQVDEGEKGAVNNLRALGLGGSGAALKALTRFRTGLADQTYGKYMDRLDGVSQDGQNAADTIGGWDVQTGANIANTRMNGAAAGGNMIMGGASNNNGTIMNGANSVNNAIQSGTNNLTDAYINGGNNIANNMVDMGTAAASGTAGGTNAWLKALGNGMNGAGTALGSYGNNWDFLGKAA